MSSLDADSDKSPSRFGASSFTASVVIALIGAGATIGGGLLTYKLQAQSALCADFNNRYDKIEDINDSGKKLKRLRALITEKEAHKCGTYASALHEKDDLENQISESRGESGGESNVLTGLSGADADTITAQQFEPEKKKTDDPIMQTHTQAASVVATLQEQPLITSRSVAEGVTHSATSSEIEFAPQQGASPVLTVTPQSTMFEGQIGEKLILSRDISYALRPLQYYTTSYSVAGGDVVVSVDGKPHFRCKKGNTFRLYWQNTPDFFAMTHSKSATLTVVNLENGPHLGISDCEPATG